MALNYRRIIHIVEHEMLSRGRDKNRSVSPYTDSPSCTGRWRG